ncbi:MAG: winged helix-turn-helix transcriptional regulator [Candidatus Thorarchaeota archaeon]|jgi:Lrp/AsnC family leucine-responsive transcriptional regulator
MDLLDKSIILELMTDSRVSCQELADRYGSSRGVVRKRINKLQERGVIQQYTAWYSLAMMEATFVLGHVRLSQQLSREEIVKQLDKHPLIHAVVPTATGDILFHSIVVGVDGLAELGSSIRKLDDVDDVELHLIQSDRGRKVELKNIHLNVLAVLIENSRLSVAEISRRTGLSPRRIKKSLDEIVTDGGIVLAIARNPALGSGVSFYMRIVWDEKKADVQNIMKHMEQTFPAEIWESYVSASDSVLFTRFSVEHIKEVERVSNAISQFEEVKALETLVIFPARISMIISRARLREDILNAGFDITCM